MAVSTKTRAVVIAMVLGLIVGVVVTKMLFGQEPAPDYTTSYGSPPMIPHAPFSAEKCTDCHGPSTHSKELGVPTTSHPERTMCRQCHVPMRDTKLFKANSYRKP